MFSTQSTSSKQLMFKAPSTQGVGIFGNSKPTVTMFGKPLQFEAKDSDKPATTSFTQFKAP